MGTAGETTNRHNDQVPPGAVWAITGGLCVTQGMQGATTSKGQDRLSWKKATEMRQFSILIAQIARLS